MDRSGLTRRQMFQLASAGAVCGMSSSWLGTLAADAAANPARRKSCILLWMSGGPSQIDTFDPKPGHANNGPGKPIETAVPGISSASTCPAWPGRSRIWRSSAE